MKLWKVVLLALAVAATIPLVNVGFRNLNMPSDFRVGFGILFLCAVIVGWVYFAKWFIRSTGLAKAFSGDTKAEGEQDHEESHSSRGSSALAVLIVTLVVVVLIVILFAICATRIGPGHVGIEVDMAGSQRGVQDFTLKTGWVFYNPFSTQVKEYPTYVQTAVWTASKDEGHPINEELTFTTKDSMVVKVDVNMSYRLDSPKVPAFYVMFRSDDLDTFTHGFLHNLARDIFNETAGKYSVEQIMGDNGPFLSEVRAKLQEKMILIGVIIEQFGLVNAPRPPQGVIDSINSKVQAGQIALQKNNEVLQATADANKAIASARGQAESNRIVTGSITPQLLEWQRIQLQYQQLAVTDRWVNRWNGVMPLYSGTGGMPLIQLPSPQGQK